MCEIWDFLCRMLAQHTNQITHSENLIEQILFFQLGITSIEWEVRSLLRGHQNPLLFKEYIWS